LYYTVSVYFPGGLKKPPVKGTQEW
jgi:hypothetical protein